MSDFEIIKRKFANMIDIITYDDLVVRLKKRSFATEEEMQRRKINGE